MVSITAGVAAMDKIICIGKNYLEHAKELGDAVPEKPVLFLKPPSILRSAKQGEVLELAFPDGPADLHHECEIVIEIARDFNEAPSGPMPSDLISAVTVGLDMTKRDLQAKLKKAGHPWAIAKVFQNSAIVGPLVPVGAFSGWASSEFSLAINGSLRQKGVANQMTLCPLECVRHAASFFPLRRGDLLFTGTPAGVGPVNRGDHLELRWGTISYSVAWK